MADQHKWVVMLRYQQTVKLGHHRLASTAHRIDIGEGGCTWKHDL